MNLDWKWTAVHAAPIPNGTRVVLKMADTNDRITYALGYENEQKQLVITAQEDKAGTLPVYWMALP